MRQKVDCVQIPTAQKADWRKLIRIILFNLQLFKRARRCRTDCRPKRASCVCVYTRAPLARPPACTTSAAPGCVYCHCYLTKRCYSSSSSTCQSSALVSIKRLTRPIDRANKLVGSGRVFAPWFKLAAPEEEKREEKSVRARVAPACLPLTCWPKSHTLERLNPFASSCARAHTHTVHALASVAA